ncbi:hypothetical protein J5N97_017206 [Dioscorea zingiberensis]|uniref:Uncharacterized protein n=1 Tax=Dioscorea zingiberensis TaxID=325984 RepID=A0A9D5HFX3_9LILI|nr:hypothetical protein J5N97_017206 [Dioscorea zingiberensis]
MLEGKACLISRALPSSCEQESKWIYMTYELLERSNNKRPMSDELTDNGGENLKRKKSLENPLLPNNEELDPSTHENDGNGSVGSTLISNSLISFRLAGTIQSTASSIVLVQIMAHLHPSAELPFPNSEWRTIQTKEADGRWLTLPKLPHNECFMCSDKESLAVGTELLVFGKEVTAHIVLRYSILTNSWTDGEAMNYPRCLFGSASLGEKAIVAGGTDAHGTILSSAELYNSETRTWVTLPSMNKPRKMCSGVFMDGKFYVIGGMSSSTQLLTCGEEYDLKKQSWRVIPNMSSGLNGASGAPPLVAVVNNELYAAHYSEKEIRKYDKVNNNWITLGRLPERPVSMNGWGLAFRACGERLIVIGGPRALGGGMIELHSWIPKEGPPEWNMIASKHSGSFVFNCAVMGC